MLGLEGFEPPSAGIFRLYENHTHPLIIEAFRASQRSRCFYGWSPLGCQVTPQPRCVLNI